MSEASYIYLTNLFRLKQRLHKRSFIKLAWLRKRKPWGRANVLLTFSARAQRKDAYCDVKHLLRSFSRNKQPVGFFVRREKVSFQA